MLVYLFSFGHYYVVVTSFFEKLFLIIVEVKSDFVIKDVEKLNIINVGVIFILIYRIILVYLVYFGNFGNYRSNYCSNSHCWLFFSNS